MKPHVQIDFIDESSGKALGSKAELRQVVEAYQVGQSMNGRITPKFPSYKTFVIAKIEVLGEDRYRLHLK